MRLSLALPTRASVHRSRSALANVSFDYRFDVLSDYVVEILPDVRARQRRDDVVEMNLAETAFLYPENGGYRLRWFTPLVEVDLCGHATLATAHVLAAVTGQKRRWLEDVLGCEYMYTLGPFRDGDGDWMAHRGGTGSVDAPASGRTTASSS